MSCFILVILHGFTYVIPSGDAKTKCPNRFAIPHFYFPSLMKTSFQRLENKNVPYRDILFCGETGIRTPEGLASLTVFKTAAFNHSAISPYKKNYLILCILNGFTETDFASLNKTAAFTR